MILYTVYPEEVVLAGLDPSTGEGPTPPGGPPAVIEKRARGASGEVRLVLEAGPGGGWRVGRLVSSDPSDFLDPRFTPGREVPRPEGIRAGLL